MPFTPFHMGPALAVKALAGRYFSVLTFGIAQVAMDIEPLVGMIRGAEVLHGWSHTYLGALVIAGTVVPISPAICRPILRRWNQELSHYRLGRLASAESFSSLAVVTGALVGTLSHVALDSIMLSDMRPFAPIAESNGLLHSISIAELHLSCVGAGIIGIAVWLLVGLLRRGRE